MFVHPLSAPDLVSQRRADLERAASNRRVARQAANVRRASGRPSVANVLAVVAKAVMAGEADPRVSSLLLDVLVRATHRRVPAAPLAAPSPTDPIVVHQRAIGRLAAATARRDVVLDAEEWPRVARLLPLLTGSSTGP